MSAPTTEAGKALLNAFSLNERDEHGAVIGHVLRDDPYPLVAAIEKQAAQIGFNAGREEATLTIRTMSEAAAKADTELLALREALEGARAMSALTFRTLSARNLDRCVSPNGFNHPLSAWSLSDWMTAAMGEFGEAANKVKKLNRVRDGIAGNAESEDELRAGLADEIADAVIYLDLLAQALGISLESAIVSKFDRTSEKIGAPHRLREAAEGERPSSVRVPNQSRPTRRSGVRLVHEWLASEIVRREDAELRLAEAIHSMVGGHVYLTDEQSRNVEREQAQSLLAALRKEGAAIIAEMSEGER